MKWSLGGANKIGSEYLQDYSIGPYHTNYMIYLHYTYNNEMLQIV